MDNADQTIMVVMIAGAGWWLLIAWWRGLGVPNEDE